MSAEGEQARQFAQRLENLLQNVLPTCDNAFTATPQGKYGKRGKTVYLIQQRDNSGIPLTCDGDEILRLQYSFLCSCKTPQSMLQVDKSDILLATDSGHSPLCHYDYVRSPQSDIPAAHINIHGSNDAATRIMLSCVNGKRSKTEENNIWTKVFSQLFHLCIFLSAGIGCVLDSRMCLKWRYTSFISTPSLSGKRLLPKAEKNIVLRKSRRLSTNSPI